MGTAGYLAYRWSEKNHEWDAVQRRLKRDLQRSSSGGSRPEAYPKLRPNHVLKASRSPKLRPTPARKGLKISGFDAKTRRSNAVRIPQTRKDPASSKRGRGHTQAYKDFCARWG